MTWWSPRIYRSGQRGIPQFSSLPVFLPRLGCIGGPAWKYENFQVPDSGTLELWYLRGRLFAFLPLVCNALLDHFSGFPLVFCLRWLDLVAPDHKMSQDVRPRKLTWNPKMFGKWFSFSKGPISGSTLVFRTQGQGTPTATLGTDPVHSECKTQSTWLLPALKALGTRMRLNFTRLVQEMLQDSKHIMQCFASLATLVCCSAWSWLEQHGTKASSWARKTHSPRPMRRGAAGPPSNILSRGICLRWRCKDRPKGEALCQWAWSSMVWQRSKPATIENFELDRWKLATISFPFQFCGVRAWSKQLRGLASDERWFGSAKERLWTSSSQGYGDLDFHPRGQLDAQGFHGNAGDPGTRWHPIHDCRKRCSSFWTKSASWATPLYPMLGSSTRKRLEAPLWLDGRGCSGRGFSPWKVESCSLRCPYPGFYASEDSTSCLVKWRTRNKSVCIGWFIVASWISIFIYAQWTQ